MYFSPLDAPVKQKVNTQHKVYSDSDVVPQNWKNQLSKHLTLTDFHYPSAEEEKEPAKPFY